MSVVSHELGARKSAAGWSAYCPCGWTSDNWYRAKNSAMRESRDHVRSESAAAGKRARRKLGLDRSDREAGTGAPYTDEEVAQMRSGGLRWVDLFGIDPDYCEGKPIDQWLEESRGDA